MGTQQMLLVPREWLAAYLGDDTAKVEVDGVPTSLWELLSTIADKPAKPVESNDQTYADEPLSYIKELGDLVQDARGIEISGNARKVAALLLCGAAVPELVARIEELEGNHNA